jgi:hypothetical protein
MLSIRRAFGLSRCKIPRSISGFTGTSIRGTEHASTPGAPAGGAIPVSPADAAAPRRGLAGNRRAPRNAFAKAAARVGSSLEAGSGAGPCPAATRPVSTIASGKRLITKQCTLVSRRGEGGRTRPRIDSDWTSGYDWRTLVFTREFKFRKRRAPWRRSNPAPDCLGYDQPT